MRSPTKRSRKRIASPDSDAPSVRPSHMKPSASQSRPAPVIEMPAIRLVALFSIISNMPKRLTSRLCIDACSFKIHGLVKQKNGVLRLYPSVMTLMMRSSLPLAQISAMVRSFYDRRLRTLHG
jgi:hypothetical protein